MTIGERLRQVRLRQGLTLSALARETGLSKGFISQVEVGSTNASVASLSRFAQALSVPLAELVQDAAPPMLAPLGPILVRHRAPASIQPALSTVSSMQAGTVVTASLRMGSYLESSAGTGKSGSFYCMALTGDVKFGQSGSILRLTTGDSLTWDAQLPWKLENAGVSPASVLLFVSAGVALPTVVERRGPARLPAQFYPARPAASDSKGPFRLVAMRAARGGGRGR